jgi:transcriptional regulator with XRE-family HTH domain
LTGKQVAGIRIGEQISLMRINQKRTLQEIADASELSRNMIFKIENNKTVPSTAALVKIARSLGTNISILLEHAAVLNAIITTKQKAEHNLTITDKGYRIHPYGSEDHEK